MAPPKGFKHSTNQRALISAGLRWRWANDVDYRRKHSKLLTIHANRPDVKERSRKHIMLLNKNKVIRQQQWETRKAKEEEKEKIYVRKDPLLTRFQNGVR